jgi:hypothetical protein
MIQKLVIFCCATLLFSCQNKQKLNVQNFKTGTFEIAAGKDFDQTTFIRKDSFQIETYGDKTDSLSIVWKDNFNYTLKMLNPKSGLDREPIRVKITGITSDSYDFEAIIGYSNYKQNGTVTKISN